MAKGFRHSPQRAADSLKIIVGNKTNATIRELEETEEDIEEFEGTVVSIEKDKINGNGWEVKTTDGDTYQCTCGNTLYDLPETEEYGGVYYPTGDVKVKIEVNPILRTNTITEITSLGEDETKIDLSKWKHGDNSTKIIAKPKSALSVSNAVITMNYNNDNSVSADKDEVKTSGKKTNINTNTLAINSDDIYIKDELFDDYLNDLMNNNINAQKNKNINVLNQNNMSQINLNITGLYIPAKDIIHNTRNQRIIKDLKDPSLFPEMMQKHPLLTGSKVNEIYIYPNGLVTVQSIDDVWSGKEDVVSTHNWITTSNIYKNLLTVTVIDMCDCCDFDVSGQQTYFNYCPYCHTWNTLYNSNNIIKCNACSNTWCQGCGHSLLEDCGMIENDLKPYNSTWTIRAIGVPCKYCENEIPYGKTREYANYCPKCNSWGYLSLQTDYEETEERRFLYCSSCEESYCVNCSTSQGKSFITSFLNDDYYYYYDDFTEKYFKIKHIRDD